ncbi:DUF1304 domain-containing protein [Brevibacterium spongiae]|uniref:DUF1304 domain-containing protein n=1 Tax=Brevibacterium spongiae TaxID=2909672 RepID=A0ABY5SUV9_9MICO|nr:DUF1304 domain-containing protein [Brevibacterium spongiae]UVI36886.1 DUF1304 domain-containing protein [Brevibacterium spongiae]
MTITGLVLTGLAAVLHVFIFYLESVAWTSPRARATFGTTEAEAEATKSLAFNQGFYNLFLALAVFIGIIVFAAGSTQVGLTLVFVGAGSMLAAALVLALSSPELIASALKQGTLPLLGVACLLVGVLI